MTLSLKVPTIALITVTYVYAGIESSNVRFNNLLSSSCGVFSLENFNGRALKC